MRKLVSAAAALMVAACASGGSSSGWSASTWNGLAPQNVYGGGYQFFAAPAEGQGFKLKFTLKTDGNFGIASGGAPTDEELEEAAKAAAPEGCTFVSVQRTADGGALADYDCDAEE
ncbi:MAG: hypothetical protein R3C00_06695 [Hyphomonas sp.]|nr:hypothetical protein [Hyphomonas sp.]MCB9972862.1 hypothetical protein [Hyphomonas sp.]